MNHFPAVVDDSQRTALYISVHALRKHCFRAVAANAYVADVQAFEVAAQSVQIET